MPIYQYDCNECNAGFELSRSVDERYNNLQCPSCGAKSNRKEVEDAWEGGENLSGSITIRVGPVSVHTFSPHYSEGLGVWLNSQREEDVICKEKGLENVGDMNIDDIDTEARRQKRHADEAQDKKGPPPEFYKTYYQIMDSVNSDNA